MSPVWARERVRVCSLPGLERRCVCVAGVGASERLRVRSLLDTCVERRVL